jgi:hypothetical protein
MSAMMLISSIIVRRRSVVSGFWNRYRMFTSLPRVVFNTRDDCNRSSCMRVDPLFTSILKFWVYLHSEGRGERGDLSSLKAEDLLFPLQREGREILTVWELRIYWLLQTASVRLCLGTSSASLWRYHGTSSSWLCPVRDCLLETVFWRLLLETVFSRLPSGDCPETHTSVYIYMKFSGPVFLLDFGMFPKPDLEFQGFKYFSQ